MPFLAALALAVAQVAIPATPIRPAPAAQSAPAAAAPKALSIGDRAPELAISDWIKGDAVGGFEPGRVYVVEFWATWCGPCRTTMPHLSDLQAKHADDGVTILGVSDEAPETVREFLAKPEWAEKTAYTLAADPDRSTHTAYMRAAGQSGIPTAFLVGRDGTVQWIGHPSALDAPLAATVAGTWDAAAFRARFDAEREAEQARRATMGRMREALQRGDWDAVLALHDEVLARNPDDLQTLLAKAQILLTKAKRPADGYAIARDIADRHGDNAMALNALAWMIVDNPEVTERDVPFATKVATLAVAASDGKDPAILDTLARCQWEVGERDAAIETQRKAVELAPAGRMADDMRETLKKYEADPKG